MIVARHEVPGFMRKIARPSGTVERISVLIGRQHTFQQEYLGFLKRHEHPTRCRLLMSGSGFDDEFLWDWQRLGRPSGTRLSGSLPRHFVPGYYQPVPPGRKALAYPGPRIKLAPIGVPPHSA
jgi:hypothetical protein